MIEWLKRLFAPARLPALPAPSDDPMAIYHGAKGYSGRRRLLRRWFDTVQVGDVLEAPGGRHRVVREVSRYRNGELRSLTFAIKKCSWTGRPYTQYGFTDLRMQGWRPTGVRIRLDSEMDVWLQADINSFNCRTVTCCEAKAMP